MLVSCQGFATFLCEIQLAKIVAFTTSLCYFSKMLQIRTLHARLCSDLAYVYSNQSSCVLVGQKAPFHNKHFSVMINFSTLLTTFVNRRVTNHILATCNACMACVQ